MRVEGTNWRTWRLGAAALAVACLAGLLAWGADGRLIERTATVTVTTDEEFGVAEARCPKGKRVVLGGVELPTAVEDLSVNQFKREGKRRWITGGQNFSSDDVPLTSIAYCAKLKGVKARTETVTVPTLDTGGPTTVTAKCRRKERLAFGGVELATDGGVYLDEARRTGKRGWLVGAINFDAPRPLTAIAYCSKQAPKTSTVSETVEVEPDSDAVVSASCGRRQRLAFGGYSGEVTGNNAFVLLHGLSRESARTWQVSAHNDNPVFSGDLTAYAYCAKK